MTIDWRQTKRSIGRDDLISPADYAAMRRRERPELVAIKKRRRISCGPIATFYFECFATMWWQIHEMLHIEKGGEEQIADELRAYGPMVPNGRELVATLMFEIEDPEVRHHTLIALSGVEAHITLAIGGETVRAVAEAEVDRTKESDGKTSSVHFLHFPLTPDQIAAFRDPAAPVVLGIDHPEYGHMVKLNAAQRGELAGDLD